jgi:hypothetical protein
MYLVVASSVLSMPIQQENNDSFLRKCLPVAKMVALTTAAAGIVTTLVTLVAGMVVSVHSRRINEELRRLKAQEKEIEDDTIRIAVEIGYEFDVFRILRF